MWFVSELCHTGGRGLIVASQENHVVQPSQRAGLTMPPKGLTVLMLLCVAHLGSVLNSDPWSLLRPIERIWRRVLQAAFAQFCGCCPKMSEVQNVVSRYQKGLFSVPILLNKGFPIPGEQDTVWAQRSALTKAGFLEEEALHPTGSALCQQRKRGR